MRVGIDITSLLVTSGGVGRYLRNAVAGLLRADAPARYRFFPVDFERVRDGESALWASRARGRMPGLFSALGIWSAAGWNLLGRPAQDWFTGPVDVFHTSDLVPLPRRTGRIVSTIYDLAPEILPAEHNPRLRRLHQLRNRDIARRSDVVVAISESTKADVVRYLGVDAARVEVVYGGVSAAFHPRPEPEVEEARVRYGLHRPYLIFVGTIEPRKNLVRLVRAFARLRKQGVDQDLELVLVGRRGWRWEEVDHEIARLDLDAHVRRLGYVPEHDLPALLTGAVALVYPSLYEGFGFPPLEAMACGTPAIASAVSSIPEVVDGAGVLVDPYREDAITDAMGLVLSDRALRDSLVEAGRKRAGLFPWDRTGRALYGVYRSVLERS
ncbi:MAG: glycosyltransferase family 1 protein [bacterium]